MLHAFGGTCAACAVTPCFGALKEISPPELRQPSCTYQQNLTLHNEPWIFDGGGTHLALEFILRLDLPPSAVLVYDQSAHTK